MERAYDFQDVRDFHKKFSLPRNGDGRTKIELMSPEVFSFRLGFLVEELKEFHEAYQRRNLVKTLDALMDFVYVAFGTALFMGAGEEVGPWPTLTSVHAWADKAKILEGRPSWPGFPHESIYRMTFDRIDYELRLFEGIHQADHVASIPLSLSYLWNAAHAAYLGSILMNCPWTNCWRHVQEANMAKVRAMPDGSNSKRSSPWDVVKPSGWCAPDAKIAHELVIAGAILPTDVLDEALAASLPKA